MGVMDVDIAGWAGTVLTAVTLGYVVLERKERKREAASAFLCVDSYKTISEPNGGVAPILTITNTGAVAAHIKMMAIAGASEVRHQEDPAFEVKFALGPNQSFDMVLDEGARKDAWILFMYLAGTQPYIVFSWQRCFIPYEPGDFPKRGRIVNFFFRRWAHWTKRPLSVGPGAEAGLRLRHSRATDAQMKAAQERWQEAEPRFLVTSQVTPQLPGWLEEAD